MLPGFSVSSVAKEMPRSLHSDVKVSCYVLAYLKHQMSYC